MSQETIDQLISRCKLACEAESVSLGFPPSAGIDTYEACVKDDLEGWTEEQFIAWVEEMRVKYEAEPGSDRDLKLSLLYLNCSSLMGEYAKHLQRI